MTSIEKIYRNGVLRCAPDGRRKEPRKSRTDKYIDVCMHCPKPTCDKGYCELTRRKGK